MSQDLAQYDPFLRNKTRVTKSWTTTGNTDTITDSAIGASSYVLPYVYGVTPAAGRWAVSVTTPGTATITSSDSETAGLTYHYIIL